MKRTLVSCQHLFPSSVFVASFLAILLGPYATMIGAQVAPTIVKFTNQTAWNLAAPAGAGPGWCVNFNYLTADSRITYTPGRNYLDTTNVTRLVMTMEGNSTILNDIDAAPYNFSGAIDGTTYAALWVDRDSNTRVRVSFVQTAAIRAWSASFQAIGTAEALQANIVSRGNATSNTTTTIENVTNGFWGFTINEDLVSILFTAKNPNGNPNNGENFSMDNVCVKGNSTGNATIPSPSPPTAPTPPAPTPPGNDNTLCEAIPLIGPLFCLVFSIFSGLFGGIIGAVGGIVGGFF